MSKSNPIPLARAQLAWDRIRPILEPVCERVSVAGSVRRERPTVNDIDVVAIPRYRDEKDLLGQVVRRVNLAAEDLLLHARLKGWEVTTDGPEIFRAVNKGVTLDVYWSTAESWASLLVCKTGPAQHNIAMATRAKQLRLHWRPNFGLETPAQGLGLPGLLPLATEQDFYAALGLEFIPPNQRDNPALWQRLAPAPAAQAPIASASDEAMANFTAKYGAD